MHRRSRRNAPLARSLQAVALITLGLSIVASFSANAAQPNILLLMAEDLSPRIGSFGDPIARTPAIDRLAEQGVRYPNVFTTAGVCAPSRAALMLGRHQNSTGTQHMRTSDGPLGEYLAVPPPEAKAFPELLRRAGYFTYQHGKLDYQFSGVRSGTGPSSIWDAEDNDRQWADRDGDQPFFGMVNFMVTHESGIFAPLGTWPRGLFHFVMQLAQANMRTGWTENVIATDPAKVDLPPYYPDLPELRADLARQYDNIQIMDAQVAAILERLEQDGLADGTIVIWTTDHGDGLPRAKRELFESGIRVPMIIRWPESLRPKDLIPGTLDSRMISFVDLTSTILALAGVVDAPGAHGHDFLDPRVPEREYVYASRDRIDDALDRQRAVRDERYKYIRSYHPNLASSNLSDFRENQAGMRAWRAAFEAGDLTDIEGRFFQGPGEEQLYDLDQDPFEINNLIASPEHMAIRERLRAAYADFEARIPDLGAIPESELRERYWPGGEQPVTRRPVFAAGDGRISLSAPDEGASIELSIDRSPFRPYVEPFTVSPGTRLSARAIRYGWEESPVVGFRMPGQE